MMVPSVCQRFDCVEVSHVQAYQRRRSPVRRRGIRLLGRDRSHGGGARLPAAGCAHGGAPRDGGRGSPRCRGAAGGRSRIAAGSRAVLGGGVPHP